MPKNVDAAGEYLLQKCRDILGVVRDPVATRHTAGSAVAAQVEREDVEAARKFGKQNEKRLPVAGESVQQD